MTASQLLYQQVNRCGGDCNDSMMTCNIKKVAITTILVLMVCKTKNMTVAMILVKIQDQELGACINSSEMVKCKIKNEAIATILIIEYSDGLLTWKTIRSGQTQRKVSAGRGASSLLPAINQDNIW